MKPIPTTILLAIIFFLLNACKTLKTSEAQPKMTTTDLIVFQDGKEIVVHKPIETVKIGKKEFSLRFYNKRYDPENKILHTARIAAFKDPLQLDKVNVGMSMSDVPYFSGGTGLAANSNIGYDKLRLRNDAHHYTYYTNEDRKRLDLLEENGELLKLEFDIPALYYNDTDYKMSDPQLKAFYIAFLIDRNLNGIIDKGELKKLTLKFK